MRFVNSPRGLRPVGEDFSTTGAVRGLATGLLALALAAAIGFALLIVLPFYNRR